MALEALRKYAEEQKQATRAEVERLAKKDALRRPTSDAERQGCIKPLVDGEHVTEALNERLAAVYRMQQDNIQKAGQLRSEINKGVQDGEPIYKLLLKAIECISLMTGERIFFDVNKEILQTVHRALGEPEAIEVEQQEVQQRLDNLKAAYEREKESGAKQRIKAAIKAHEEKIKTLE